MTKKSKKVEFFNDSGVNVTKRISEGLTQMIFGTDIDTELDTYDLARSRKSYYYPVYNRQKHIGYGIPK
ncbi:MAG TPA: hypothetical protein DDE71_06405 [Tenacibaculum sp.]|nr:hypothetical protein [Tenacibaculum sp.]